MDFSWSETARYIGTVSVVQQGDCVNEFILSFVYPGPLVRRFQLLNCSHWRCCCSIWCSKWGAGSSIALWPCLDGFTATMAILGVNPISLLPECLPMFSTSQTRSCANLPWHRIARNGFQLWTYLPRIIEVCANSFIHLTGVRSVLTLRKTVLFCSTGWILLQQ